MVIDYNEDYYDGNAQSQNRPAIRWYYRILHREGAIAPYLDIGCGTGWLLRAFSRRGVAYGTDGSKYAKRQAEIIAPEAKFIESLEELQDASISTISMIHLLEHLTPAQVDSLFLGVNRVSRVGSLILLATPDAGGRASLYHGEGWIALKDRTHINLRSAAEWRELLMMNGWKPVVEGSDGMWNGPYRTNKKVERWAYLVIPVVSILLGRVLGRIGEGESYVGIFRRSGA